MSESIMREDQYGVKYWKNSSGQLHRLDGPAAEHPIGTKEWYQNGQRHRLNGPAVEYADGSKYWYQDGSCHREDGPAIEYKDGSTAWHYKNDFLGVNLKGFWNLWDRLNDEERQNVNLHMWLVRLQNV